jgi:hypothetical protein
MSHQIPSGIFLRRKKLMGINICMQIRDELEKYLLRALKQESLNVRDLIFHAMMYGAEVRKHHHGLSQTTTFNRFHINCICEICSRNDSNERISYALCDLIFLLFKDHIEEEVSLILSPHAEIPSSAISDDLCTKHGIKLTDVHKTKNPCQIDLVFKFVGCLATDAALRDLPLMFTATVEVNNPYGVGVFSSAGELMLDIRNIRFLDEYQLCDQSPGGLHSFYESIPKKFKSI